MRKVINYSYSLLVMTKEEMLVARDPHGLRPLSLGKLGDGWVVASETCAFDLIGAEYVREIEPGELLIINDQGVTSDRFVEPESRAMCAMEYVYLARPDSDIDGINVHMARKRMGKQLAKECAHIEADVVTGVPDSSMSAAIGFAEETGIPYELGLIKNRYVGRTFIQPTQELRERGVKMKLSPVVQVVKGKRVIMVDDSIVRGTTSPRIVRMLKEAGAAEVHVMITSPPMTNPCFYGIDTSTPEQLIASSHSVEEIREAIEADTLTFLTVDGMVRATARPFDDAEGAAALRHTTSHILAQAVKRLYPNAKLAIGPAIDEGFYYDFDVENPFSREELDNETILKLNLLLNTNLNGLSVMEINLGMIAKMKEQAGVHSDIVSEVIDAEIVTIGKENTSAQKPRRTMFDNRPAIFVKMSSLPGALFIYDFQTT